MERSSQEVVRCQRTSRLYMQVCGIINKPPHHPVPRVDSRHLRVEMWDAAAIWRVQFDECRQTRRCQAMPLYSTRGKLSAQR